MFTNATKKFWSLVTNGLAEVDGFKIYIQVCMWLGFPPWESSLRYVETNTSNCKPLNNN